MYINEKMLKRAIKEIFDKISCDWYDDQEIRADAIEAYDHIKDEKEGYLCNIVKYLVDRNEHGAAKIAKEELIWAYNLKDRIKKGKTVLSDLPDL